MKKKLRILISAFLSLIILQGYPSLAMEVGDNEVHSLPFLPKKQKSKRSLEPLDYIFQFTIPADEASRLLSPHWKHKFKGKLSKMLGVSSKEVSSKPLKDLIEKKTPTRALKMFNIALIENDEVWNLFHPLQQTQIILSQLIRITSEEEVARQLEIERPHLHSFQEDPRNTKVMSCLPKVSIENWQHEGILGQRFIPSEGIKMLLATLDHKAVPGSPLVQPWRAVTFIGGQFKALYGSSERKEGHISPDESVLRVKQQRHLEEFRAVTDIFQSADPTVSPHRLGGLMSDLSIDSSPSPGLGKIYVVSPDKQKELRQHSHVDAKMEVKVYTDGIVSPNFCSKTGESIAEVRAKCRPKNLTYEEERWYPMAAYSYQHLLPTGHRITFDRGHGCDHADTLEHIGILSTYDPDNFVPQNSFYNRNIRNHLVARIRNAGGEYKEISLYHHTPYLTDGIRIPEAFIFIELYDGKADSAYFFPNFIAYEALDFEKQFNSNYLNFLELFRVNALIEYFFIPFVQAQNPIPHMEQRDKSTILSNRIYLDIREMFSNMTEHAFPPRARSTLIKSIMNQGINTAAILDFEGLTCLETAVNHYSNNRVYWELDDRSEEERHAAFDTNFPKLSIPIQRAYEAAKNQFAEEYKDKRAFEMHIATALGSLINLMRDPDQEIMRSIIGGQSIKNIELAQKYLKVALSKLEKGVYDDRDINGIQRILFYTPEFEDEAKAEDLTTLIKDKENILRAISPDEFILFVPPASEIGDEIQWFFRLQVLKEKIAAGKKEIRSRNLNTATLFEMMAILMNEPTVDESISFESVYKLLDSIDLLQSTLIEKKKIADFLWYHGYPNEQNEWIRKIADHFEKEPTQNHARLFSSWLRDGSGCIKKNTDLARGVLEIAEEHASEQARRKPSDSIFFGIFTSKTDTRSIREKKY